MKASGKTSYLSSLIPPLGPRWLLLMALQRYIIYVSASDTAPPDHDPGPDCRVYLPLPLFLPMRLAPLRWFIKMHRD